MIKKSKVIDGVYFVEIPEANLYIQCGSPAESVKHLIKQNFISKKSINNREFETGPNAILLSDIMIQNGDFSNISEFPILQMFYKQCLIIPNHPNNTGIKPILIGEENQVISQMEYIHRGNYGLTSQEEIEICGINAQTAKELYNMKLAFSFGKLKSISDLLSNCIVKNTAVEIRDGVYIKRIDVNIFELNYKNDTITIDLNLTDKQNYESPYSLLPKKIKKDYFSIIQSGQGDGWDVMRPSMNSIICFDGKYYLIDVVPNIHYILDSLSISVNQIEGVFLTHCHDDHIAGITTLIRSDKKIKIYGAKIVTASLIKKLSALLMLEESNFKSLLDIQELTIDVYNNIDNIEIKPIISAHPVETTIFIFRTYANNKYYSYGHFADIPSYDTLKEMLLTDKNKFGVTQKFYEKTIKVHSQKLDIKKIDIGEGLVHGNSRDFIDDKSEKIILAHTSKKLTKEQLKIGTSSDFGTQDTLISSKIDYDDITVKQYLQSSFPTLSKEQLEPFFNFKIVHFNPKEILHNKNEKINNLYLIISGLVEKRTSNSNALIILDSGVITGEKVALNNQIFNSSFMAKNHVKALKIPLTDFVDFITKYNLNSYFNDKFEIGYHFLKNKLFNENISYPTINKLIKNMTIHKYQKSDNNINIKNIYIIIKGSVNILVDDTIISNISVGDYFGGVQIILNTPSIFTYEIADECELYSIPANSIKEIPIVFWKMLEQHELLMKKEFNIN